MEYIIGKTLAVHFGPKSGLAGEISSALGLPSHFKLVCVNRTTNGRIRKHTNMSKAFSLSTFPEEAIQPKGFRHIRVFSCSSLRYSVCNLSDMDSTSLSTQSCLIVLIVSAGNEQ